MGVRIRQRRQEVGWTQAALGNAIGLSFKQIRKYERGVNRVSASTLFLIADALGVSVDYFYGDLDDMSHPREPESIALIEHYYRIGDSARREAFLKLVRTIGRVYG